MAALQRLPKPQDSDLLELFDRAAWINAMASMEAMQRWVTERLALACSETEGSWLMSVLKRLDGHINAQRRREQVQQRAMVRQRRLLLSKVTALGRKDIQAQKRLEAAELREEEKRIKWFASEAFQRQQQLARQKRWELRKQALIAREEERRQRASQGRWLISR